MLIIRRQGRVLGFTDDGRELLHYARQLIALNDTAYRAVAQSKIPSRIRLGVPSDFMSEAFLDLLKDFRDSNGGVELEVVSDVSRRLLEQAQNGVLDVAFFKQFPGQGSGSVVCRRQLVWFSAPNRPVPPAEEPLPLILFPEGSVVRSVIFNALEAAGRYWRIAYSCTSLENLKLAIRHGMGFSALPRELLPSDAAHLEEVNFLPVGEIEVAVIYGRNCGLTARTLAERITQHFSDTPHNG
jgi:DNA-binding transcriptional LysR family regulator